MNKIISIGLIAMLCIQLSYADNSAKSKVFPLSKSKFAVMGNNGEEKIVDLAGQNYIVVSVREQG
ncbi:MAG: L,D-transpeptidase, partial [Campylobacterota bacterium]|nr:L,D-transpeptidase [Campylobacterota bacterium]